MLICSGTYTNIKEKMKIYNYYCRAVLPFGSRDQQNTELEYGIRKVMGSRTKKITRVRTIKSCKYCYTHKLKCDKGTPCSRCLSMEMANECTYGFNRTNGATRSAAPLSKVAKGGEKMWNVIDESALYKSKYFYPFFTSSINDRILSAEAYGKIALSENFVRNEITNFDRLDTCRLSSEEIFNLFPSGKSVARAQVESFFENIHPVIPIISKQKLLLKLDNLYKYLESDKQVSVLDVLLLAAIFFCSAYANVASGIIPDLLLCNKYYAAYKSLLDVTGFPMRPNIEPLQAFVLVNFVTDPNMVEATGYSPMLVRVGQQLGLHELSKPSFKKNKESADLILLWHYLLFIEGSSSVVSGFAFSTTPEVFRMVPLPDEETIRDDNFPIEFTLGRFTINVLFREIMDLTSREAVSEAEHKLVVKHIEEKYIEINRLVGEIHEAGLCYDEYFTSTLRIFLYRLHLRYFALDTLRNQKNKVLVRTNGELEPVETKNITWILETTQNVREEVLPLSLLLLLYTLKRLVQKDMSNFMWYTKGSTVMQYLFVVLRDLYQNPRKVYSLWHFPNLFRSTIDHDISDIINTGPLFYKYMLIEELLKLLEFKLAPLWTKNDLYKFVLVKTVKEKVWATHSEFIASLTAERRQLIKCKLFSSGTENLKNSKSISFEDCLVQWNSEPQSFDPGKILVEWLEEFR
ncbi:Zn(II)2Cys6 transcription factor KNAG_0D03450 [Huiozyma naganishii CBS 8797]|uniref:Zn(2)-C6 fungal-type domain-containing protein n=1 Tax=Huiozyma naganishii (strain ATCC MYA-139 / BCRC 22969 / CBS 8797 / KCTC 17520 / NBRC 10181 / NCYC 3082 / Yp74L-3) TaxID=1071383 RepID=J7RY85_HUIN7|nr:hypothetical protein KNAG_0D03450 [Kazachstania naganishii CBS 8797]CCK70092.1 hypothetical protein KNAG_0D03450 [Kazachstania naganishii CBS 8797]